MDIVNIAGYKFVSLADAVLPTLRISLKARAVALGLKGTILLAPEGINAFLAGERTTIDTFLATLHAIPEFHNMHFKESFTDYQPFNRMLVRLKKEIIPMGDGQVIPEKKTAPYLSPETFKKWYEEKHDMVVLDTRNDFEVNMGTFENAMDLHLQHFRDFPEAVDLLPENMKEKPIVTFCTGGIRCEKAAAFMLQKGFKHVYQLEGGILNYFEKCGGAFYQGDCFVFDQRVAVNSALQETAAKQCFDCRGVVSSGVMRCGNCGSDSVSEA